MEFSSADNLVITEISNSTDEYGKSISSIKFELSPLQDEYLMLPLGMYVNDANDARNRYELLSCSGANYKLNEWYPVKAGEIYEYTLNFEGFDPCVSSINIFEPKIPGSEPWIWKKIKINHSCEGNPVSNVQPFNPKPSKTLNEKVIIGY